MGLETIENMKNMEDTEMMEDNDLKHSICQRDDSKHPSLRILWHLWHRCTLSISDPSKWICIK